MELHRVVVCCVAVELHRVVVCCVAVELHRVVLCCVAVELHSRCWSGAPLVKDAAVQYLDKMTTSKLMAVEAVGCGAGHAVGL